MKLLVLAGVLAAVVFVVAACWYLYSGRDSMDRVQSAAFWVTCALTGFGLLWVWVDRGLT